MGNTSSQKLTGGGGGSCGSGHWRRNRAWTPPAAVSSDHQPPSPVVGAQLAERHLEGRGVPEADEALIEAVARTVLLPPGDVDGAGIDHQPLPRRAGDGGIAEGGGERVLLEIHGVGELVPAGLAVREVHLPGDLGIVRGDLLDDVAGLVVAVDAEPGRLLAHLPTAVLEPFGARIGRPPRHLRPDVVLVGRRVPDPGDADRGVDDATYDALLFRHGLLPCDKPPGTLDPGCAGASAAPASGDDISPILHEAGPPGSEATSVVVVAQGGRRP